MTRLIVETDNEWTKKKIRDAINTETDILKNVIKRTKVKLNNYEKKHGRFNRKFLYGKIDDMVLLEWEGEIETQEKLKKKLKSLKVITFEYR